MTSIIPAGDYKLCHPGKDKRELPLGWFSINPNLTNQADDTAYEHPSRNSLRRTRRKGLRGGWFEIRRVASPRHNQRAVFRVLAFDPTLHSGGASPHDLVLDWDGRAALSDDENGVVRLEFHAVKFPRQLLCAWNHPNPTDRLALRLAIVLGALSFVISIIGIATD
jgi:hypothetical protein